MPAATIALVLALGLLATASAPAEPWLTVSGGSGRNLTLLELAPGSLYLLRPACLVLSVRVADQCGFRSALVLRLRLWTPVDLARARRGLAASGHCGLNSTCHVAPLGAFSAAVEDREGLWRSEPWRNASGGLPGTLLFVMRQERSASGGGQLCSDNRTRPLTAPERSQLGHLAVRLLSNVTSPGLPPRNVTFTFDDVLQTAGRLGIAVWSSGLSTVGRADLARLAAGVLRGELRSLRATPSALERAERALTALKRGDPLTGRALFILKSRAELGRVAVTVVQAPHTRQLNLSVPVDLGPPATSSASLPAVVERLQRRIARLEAANRLSRSRWSSLNSSLAALTSRNQALEGENLAVRESLAAISMQLAALTRTANGTAGGREAPTADRQLEAGAFRPPLMQIDDCADVRRRRLAAGVYLLSAARRPVLCTADGSLVVLRRAACDVGFDRSYQEYERGFGDPRRGDFFVGLNLLSALTAGGDACATLSMVPFGERAAVRAIYSNFVVAGRADGHRLDYTNFTGGVHRDSLWSARGRPFTTRDQDGDNFLPVNCAELHGAGGWYNKCDEARIFGQPARPGRQGRGTACWRGVRSGERGEACAPLSSLTMTLRRAADGPSRRWVVFEAIAPCSRWECRSRLRHVPIERTGLYTVTAGGGAGGPSWDRFQGRLRRPGGRGAVAWARLVLQAGTNLTVVVGCGGGRNVDGKNYGGPGGNATIVADRARGRLLLMAGGGGGAASHVPGLPGRASESGGHTWWSKCDGGGSAKHIRQRTNPDQRGQGWPDVRSQVLGGSGTGNVPTGETRTGNWARGGCGGGYSGGHSEWIHNFYAPGGGGGSFCNATAAIECGAEEGGNFLEMGFLLIERHACF